jgi:hypothetical protein
MNTSTSRTRTTKRKPRVTIDTRLAHASAIIRAGSKLKAERDLLKASGQVYTVGSPAYKAQLEFDKLVRSFK